MDAIASQAAGASLKASQALCEAFAAAVDAHGGTFASAEAHALALANELVQRWTAQALTQLEQDLPREVVIDGARYRQHQRGRETYYGLAGATTIARWTYREIGVRNGPTVVPLALRAGLVEGATPALAFSLAQGYAQMPLRTYAAELTAAHRCVPARSTLERLGKALARALDRALPALEPTVRATERLPATVASLSVGLDRTAAPMAEPPPTPRASRRRTPYVRRPPAPVDVVYRMAYVGTVALHDASGTVLATRRFAASAGEGPARLVARVVAEVVHVRRQRPATPVVIVQDGAPELWTLLDDAFARQAIVPAHRLIDRYHVDERLAAAIEIMTADPTSARRVRDRWRAALDRSDTAIDRITRDLARVDWALGLGAADGDRVPAHLAPFLRKHLPAARQREFTGHLEYLLRHRARIRYATARRRGFPIGSGVTEGACKSVVAMRCKRSGQRWSDGGLTGCLRLRALLLSERLPQTFALLQKSYVREIRHAA